MALTSSETSYRLHQECLAVPDPTATGYLGTHSPSPQYLDDAPAAKRSFTKDARPARNVNGEAPDLGNEGTN